MKIGRKLLQITLEPIQQQQQQHTPTPAWGIGLAHKVLGSQHYFLKHKIKYGKITRNYETILLINSRQF